MPTQELQFVLVNIKEASDEVWENIIDIQLVSFQEDNPNDPLPPRDLIRKSLGSLDEHPFFTFSVNLLQVGEAIIGYSVTAFPRSDSPEYESQKHMGLLMPFVLPEYRKQGIGRTVLQKAVKDFHEQGLTLIQGDANNDTGRAFAEKFGATVGMEARINRLYTKDIDWDLVQSWCDQCSQANPDVSIEMFEGLPNEADMEAYAKFYTEVVNQVPLEELEGLEMTFTPEKLHEIHKQHQERGDVHIVRITREKDGSISGLTEIYYNPQRPHLISQDLTGVQEQYRGRGLGKWLKTDMLLFIREQYPDAEFISTGNATVNAPMLAINEGLGFKLYKHSTMYKLQVADAMKYLGIE